VYLDGIGLHMAAGEYEQQHTLGRNILGRGQMTLLWQLFRPVMGQSVEITTGQSPGPWSNRPAFFCLDPLS
jgi:hypothetical protein